MILTLHLLQSIINRIELSEILSPWTVQEDDVNYCFEIASNALNANSSKRPMELSYYPMHNHSQTIINEDLTTTLILYFNSSDALIVDGEVTVISNMTVTNKHKWDDTVVQ
jgi:hypothetical protein